ncbi:MAG TPA: hypothetical protein VEV17_26135 [Bryobacteraceae bacterium]|nr:hypothetical protein [Bryobacteraceae bacterium]
MYKLTFRAAWIWLLIFPVTAFADLSQTTTLTSGQALNLDTGATAGAGGDLLYTGSSLAPQGKAGVFPIPGGGADAFAALTQAVLAQFPLALYSASPIPSAQLTVNALIAVHTNGGNYAKVLVTAAGGGSITLQFVTFGASGGGGGGGGGGGLVTPSITSVLNAYSFVTPGLPGYGIAPGAKLIINGSNLGDPAASGTQSSAPPGLPLKVNNTSLTATVNGTVTQPALYSVSATQIVAVLPSTTPVGTGTLTVTYNGQTSTAVTLTVVQSAVGFETVNENGAGLAVATNLAGNALGYTSSADIGQTIILSGSGAGADTANDDRTSPNQQDNLSNIPMQIFIGGVQATLLYVGRAQNPGMDSIQVVVPPGLTPGCFVSVIAVVGTVVSNSATIPVNPGGGTCADSNSGITGDLLLSLGGQTNVNSGSLTVAQITGPSGQGGISTFNAASANFQNTQGAQFSSGFGFVSIGSCIVTLPTASGSTNSFQTTGLDAGAIRVTGPTEGPITLMANPISAGSYVALLDSGFIPDSGGAFTFDGSGGNDVGSFEVIVNFPNPLLSWTNMTSVSPISQSQGLTVTWTGGDPNSDVEIFGSSSSGNVSVGFVCFAPVSWQSFTVPSYVLYALPLGDGSLSLFNATTPVSFTAAGLNNGVASGAVGFTIDATYSN